MQGGRLGPYRIVSELGSGGMGTVYLAEVADGEPGRRVALKLIHAHLVATPGFFKRFVREAEMGRRIRHENVVATLDADAVEADGKTVHFLVMEYVEGQTLRALLADLGRVPEGLCRHVGREVAKGLAAIHAAGVVHRDLKPENVLITRENVVKVMDLGVARLADESVRLSQTGSFVGSVQYAAPEQFRGGGATVDGRADLHALGLVLYELSTASHPYADDDFRVVIRRLLDETPRRCAEINPQLSPYFEEVVHTLLAKRPEERFPSGEALLRVLADGEKSEWWRARAKAIRVETHQPLRRIRIPRETALYGRDAELAKLRGLFDQARSGDGQVVLIEGEAGVGKSRLVDDFVGLLHREGHEIHFLWGSYPPGGAATAAGAFSTAYREHFGDEDLDEALRESLPQTPLLVPAFAALLRGDATPPSVEPLTKDSLQSVFVHCTRSLAAERPTVVLIDDVHFAPEDGRSLFSALAHAVAGHRVLLVGTACAGLPSRWLADLDRLEHVCRMPLARLGPKDVGELLVDVFNSRRLAEELGFDILTKSDGNPFFVFEIVRGLREGKFIAEGADGTWSRTQVIGEIDIPSSVMEMIEARISDLSPDDRNLLDVAACCGFEFDPLLVGLVLGVPRIPVLQRLAHLEKSHRIVRSAGVRFLFDHHQIRESLYEGMPELLRREYHAAIAEALQMRERTADRDPAKLPGPLAFDLCRHFLAGDRGESARRYLGAALDHLEKGHLLDAVVDVASRALAAPGLVEGTERLALLLRKAERLRSLGRDEEERAAVTEAVALADRLGDAAWQARVCASLGNFYVSATRLADARRAYEAALAHAKTAGSLALEATAEGGLGYVEGILARGAASACRFERQLALAREIGDPSAEASALGSLGVGAMRAGRSDEARRCFEDQLRLAIAIGARSVEASVAGNLHLVAAGEGRLDEARRHLERALAIHRELGDRRKEMWFTGNLGDLLWNYGRCEESLELHDRQLVLAREMGSRQHEGGALANAGAVLRTVGGLERARVRLGEALAIFRETGIRDWEAYALHELGAVAFCAGATDEAARSWEAALAIRREVAFAGEVAETLLVLGRSHLAEGRADAARTELDESLATSRKIGQPFTTVLASAYLALLDPAAAPAALRTHAELVEVVPPRHRIETRFVLWRVTRDPAHLAEAWKWLEHLRDHAPADCRRSVMENVPLHRDVAAAWREHGPAAK